MAPDRAAARKSDLLYHMRLHMPLPTYVCHVAGAWRVKPLYVTSWPWGAPVEKSAVSIVHVCLLNSYDVKTSSCLKPCREVADWLSRLDHVTGGSRLLADPVYEMKQNSLVQQPGRPVPRRP